MAKAIQTDRRVEHVDILVQSAWRLGTIWEIAPIGKENVDTAHFAMKETDKMEKEGRSV